MNRIRRRATALLATAWVLPMAVFAQGEPYPSRPITLILPAGAGTGVDIMGRLAALKLGEVLGQRVVVENVVGASGVVGVQRVAKARADGYTLLFAFNQVMTMNPHVVARLPYDPEADFEPISRFAESPFVWMVNTQVPVRTFPELIGHARSHPGKLAMGVTGYASAAYLGAQLLAHQTGAEVLPVNYAANFSNDLLGNVVQVSMSPAAQVPGLLATGKVRALAQTGARRAQSLPDIPTMQEFVPGVVIDAWYAVWAPKGTPTPVLGALSAAMIKVAGMADVAERLDKLGATPVGSTSEELAQYARRETRMWGDVVKARNIKPAQ